MFDWKWYLKDIKHDKPVKVFSIFSCGGGSSMGYKRAGFEVIGNCEIDPKVNEIYKRNLHPKFNYCMDARDFARLESYPDELMHLDILDGSPPCTTFSTAGDREKSWGVEKAFAEGQKKQRLDDLFFTYLDIAERLKPKICVAENVVGLTIGNAKGYVNEIVKRFRDIGYTVQMFKLDASKMDVPQRRQRIFFIANRMGYPKLSLLFNEPPIPFGNVRTPKRKHGDTKYEKMIEEHFRTGDKCIADIYLRLQGKKSGFNNIIVDDNDVAQTYTPRNMYRACDGASFNKQDIINISTFPQDYQSDDKKISFLCGMSVPPNMMAHIATCIWEQWLSTEAH